MVLVESWDEFFAQSEALFRANPLTTRYLTKYRHKDGTLEVKVTDDKVSLVLIGGKGTPGEEQVAQAYHFMQNLQVPVGSLRRGPWLEHSLSQCLQYRTEQAQDLKRLEKLNQLFFTLTVHGEEVDLEEHQPPEVAALPVQSKPGGKKSRGNRQ